MVGDNQFETVLPYTTASSDAHVGGKVDWRGGIKARIRVPLDMPAPGDILGVVLTPEVSQCIKAENQYDVTGWIDAMIYYQPIVSDELSGKYEREIGPEEAFAVPPRTQEVDSPFDDYFLDLDQNDGLDLLEVLGVEKEIPLVGEELKKADKNPLVNCLNSRIPFSLFFDHSKMDVEPKLSPQVHSVECLIRSRRLVDLEVALDLLAPQMDAGLHSEVDAVEAVDDTTSEGSVLDMTEDRVSTEIEELDKQIVEESWDEPLELLLNEHEVIDSVELIPSYDHPILGLGYSSHSSPRRPSRNGRQLGIMGDKVVRPRALSRSTDADLSDLADPKPKSDEIKSNPRNGRRQTTLMRFQFDR